MNLEREAPAPNQQRKHAAGPWRHARIGVMLFNNFGQLLFMNDQVPLFIQRLQPAATREFGACLMPEELGTVLRELNPPAWTGDDSEDCRPQYIERVVDLSEDRLLIRGWRMSDQGDETKSRVLIMLETLRQAATCAETRIQDRYHLTEREQMVIIYLMLGFTNKEIANRINLSEHTVKEHLKRLMQKTHTTTRTGLLSCMIFPLSERSGRLGALPVEFPSSTTARPREALEPNYG
ncbi:MAG: hypothetical protein NTNFB02_26720 [Nitrospira sp.]